MFGGRRWWGSYEEVKLREQIRQARKGKLSKSQKKHLTLSGVSLPTVREKKIEKGRPFQNLSTWWEGTAVEHQLEDFVDFLEKLAFVDLVNIVAGLTIIVSLGSWALGGEERREEAKERREEAGMSASLLIAQLENDQTGAVRIALERLVRNRFPTSGLVLQETNLSGANLIRAYLKGTDLRRANLLAANLSEADLSGANLSEANLIGANLSEANLIGANLRRVDLKEANLKGADLSLSNLSEADLFLTNLREANLSGANLSGADLFKTNLLGADLSGANLSGAVLSRAFLWEADLSGANLSEANPSEANLMDIRYNEKTVWPEGFDPPPSRDDYNHNP